jgi:hypothetical protein
MLARWLALGALIATTSTGCTADRPARGAAASAHVDSLLPRDEELRRFRLDLSEPLALSGGARSRDALVQAYVRALEASDTATLAALTITRAEFAYLYYPTTPQARPPYDLSPGLLWFMLQQGSHSGLVHALEERGGRSLGFLGVRCDSTPSREGLNTVWGPCLIRRLQAEGDTVEERLFGLIVGRAGRYKLLSLANKL